MNNIMNKFKIGDIVNIVGLRQYENETMKILNFILVIDTDKYKYFYSGTNLEDKYYIFDISEEHLALSTQGV